MLKKQSSSGSKSGRRAKTLPLNPHPPAPSTEESFVTWQKKVWNTLDWREDHRKLEIIRKLVQQSRGKWAMLKISTSNGERGEKSPESSQEV